MPNVFVAGQTLPAASLNQNFSVIYNEFDGNIRNTNVASDAAIAISKINYNAQAFSKQLTGNYAWGAGLTGDTYPRISMTSDGALVFGAGAATPNVGLRWSALNTLQLYVPGGGTPNLDMNGGSILNATNLGTVSSVAMTGDNVIYNTSVTGSPITSSGTLVPTLKTQLANTFLRGATGGGATTPTFGAISPLDFGTPTANYLLGINAANNGVPKIS